MFKEDLKDKVKVIRIDIINVKDYFNLACIYIDLKEYDTNSYF